MRAKTVLAVLLALAVPLAGCVGSGGSGADPDAAPSSGGDDVGEDGDDPAGDSTTLVFDASATNDSREENGTFQPQETCNAGGCPTGDYQRAFDVTDLVPADVPVRIDVNVTYDTGPGNGAIHGDEMEMWISTDDTSFYGVDYDEPQNGRIEMGAVLVRSGGSVEVVLAAFFPVAEPDPGVDYTVRIESVVSPSLPVPSGMPVALDVEPGDRVTATAVDGGPAGFAVYGPDDTYRRHVSGEETAGTTVPDNETAGARVLVPTSESSSLRFSTTGDATTHAPLAVEWSAGEWRDVPPQGSAEWTVDVDEHPIRVGVQFRSSHPFGFGPFVGSGVTWELELPGGDTIGCSDCTYMGFGAVFNSAFTGAADARLDTGTYTLRAGTTAGAPFQVREVVVGYVR